MLIEVIMPMQGVKPDIPSLSKDFVSEQIEKSIGDLIRTVHQRVADGDQGKLLNDLRYLQRGERRMIGEWLTQQMKGQIDRDTASLLRRGEAEVHQLRDFLERVFGGQVKQQQKDVDAEALYKQLQHAEQRETGNRHQQQIQGQTKTVLELLARTSQRLGDSVWNQNDPTSLQQALLKAEVLSPKQLAALKQAGLAHPKQWLAMAKATGGRAQLAALLNLSRGQLLTKLKGVELFRIGRGQGGELGVDASIARGLQRMGVQSLKHMAMLRTLSRGDLKAVTARLRGELSGMLPEEVSRILVPRDLRHWGKEAGRMKSQLQLSSAKDKELSDSEIEEHAASWFSDQIFFSEMSYSMGKSGSPREKLLSLWAHQLEEYEYERNEEARQKEQLMREALAKEILSQEQLEDWLEQERREQEGQDEDTLIDWLSLTNDEQAQGEVCFWVSEPAWPEQLGRYGIRHLYMCFDPASGNMVPKASKMEFIDLPASTSVLGLKS